MSWYLIGRLEPKKSIRGSIHVVKETSANSLKSLSSKVTMHVLLSAAAVIACPLQTTYCHGSDSLIRDTKTVHSKEDEGKLQSWTNVGILLNY